MKGAVQQKAKIKFLSFKNFLVKTNSEFLSCLDILDACCILFVARELTYNKNIFWQRLKISFFVEGLLCTFRTHYFGKFLETVIKD